MEKFSRSKSSRNGYNMPRSMKDLRSYSCGSDYNPATENHLKEVKIVKKSRVMSAAASSSSRSWSFNVDPELQRKKRIAAYKAIGVEAKMKNSFRNSFKWIKDACNNVVNGFK